jgi:DmsE family decaheme c-type cytochrome
MKRLFSNLPLVFAAAMLLHMGTSRAGDVDWEALNPAIKGATLVNSSEQCVECHEEYMRTFGMTKMGRTLPSGGCESCHGPMSKHLDAPRQEPPLVVSFDKKAGLTPSQKASVCTQCHEDGIQINWQMSQHASADNTCTNCHNIMEMNDPVLIRTTQTQVCFQCHQDKRAQMNRRARHPVREGKVVCSDCHNPHGSPGPRQLVKNSVTETCYQCHAEKRGPYLWEHQPVREDCTNCHNPHGSNQFRMLKVRQPFLCQECHGEAYHPATFYSGDDIPPAASPAQQVVGRSCTNCHSVIHGSNHPSGSRFTR